jgi:membrane fusion protein (multidrug efflux system)
VSSRRARPLLVLVVLAILLAGGAWVAGWPPNVWPVQFADLFSKEPEGAQAKEVASAQPQQPIGFPVEVAEARAIQAWSEIRAVGTLQSDESVWIASELAGRIVEILFAEGQNVKKGDVLVRLDDALAQVELIDAQAQVELAEANYRRVSTLAETGSATQRARDEAQTELARARAVFELISARIDKLSISAPFDGTVGTRKFSVGAYIEPGVEIVNLEKIDRLKVDFKVPELFYSQIKIGQTVEMTLDALAGRTFTATIYTIDPMLDVNGRALNVRAILDNPGMELRPGFFARLVVKGGDARSVVMVPEESIVPRGDEHLLYVVEGDHAVERTVKLGARRAGAVEILEGLQAGEVVVTAGHTRLKDGSKVEIVHSQSAI